MLLLSGKTHTISIHQNTVCVCLYIHIYIYIKQGNHSSKKKNHHEFSSDVELLCKPIIYPEGSCSVYHSFGSRAYYKS